MGFRKACEKKHREGSYIKLCCLHEMLRLLLLLLMVVKPVVMALASVTSMVMVFFADVAATLFGD